MSDLCMYELEENVWDEFSESDDHIVPHPVDGRGDRFRVVGDNGKKARLEAVGAASNAGDNTKVIQKKEETNLPTVTVKDMMLDEGPWSDSPAVVFPVSCDNGSAKEVSNIACEGTKASNHRLKSANTDTVDDGFNADGTVLNEKSVVDFSLSQISSTDNGLNFFDNDSKDKGDSNILYYGWPDDIGNFEDVDTMFRNCDSTFGLGSLNNEDDMCWFPSSHSTEVAEDAQKLGSNLSSSEGSAADCISYDTQAPKLNTGDPSVNDTNKRSLLLGDKLCANTTNVAEHSGFNPMQFSIGPDARSVVKNDSLLKEQISSHKSHTKRKNHLEGKRKERNVDSGGSFLCNGNLQQLSDAKSSLEEVSHEVFPPKVRQDKQSLGSECLNSTDNLFMQIGYGQSSDLTSVCPSQYGIRSECSGLPCPPKESSFASNQVQSIEGSATAIVNGNKEKLSHRQGLQAHLSKNFICANNSSPAELYGSVHNETHQSKFKVVGQNEFETACKGVPAEVDFSNAPESSCMSSVLDEISLEASSFQQLQQVTEQLDIRTKLCIRDSLYRLARSAQQRHNCVNANGDWDMTGPLVAEGTERSTAFLDIETNTNPIDRSIAHLLFHRPSDPSTMPTNDVLSLKTHALVHGSITSPQFTANEQIRQEETANGVDQLVMSGNK
ncbi:dentin sialophosphoprotein-related [Euphorbia peplus]|nr:dentin sialophosphoprotein-related [Euphorbia peplus]